MTSSLVGVWERVSDDRKALGVYTETHLFVLSEQTTTRNGFAATYTFDGKRVRANVLIATDTNTNRQIEYEVQFEGDIVTVTLFTPGTDSPTGDISKWRKIE